MRAEVTLPWGAEATEAQVEAEDSDPDIREAERALPPPRREPRERLRRRHLLHTLGREAREKRQQRFMNLVIHFMEKRLEQEQDESLELQSQGSISQGSSHSSRRARRGRLTSRR